MTGTDEEKHSLTRKCRLSDTFLDKQRPAPPGKRITIWDTTPGFGCRITDQGTISFFVMRRRGGERKGRPIRIVLGPYGPRLSVQAARVKARAVLDELTSGVDPRERERKEREAEERRNASTFRAVADLYHVRHLQHLDRGLDWWRYIDNEILWPHNKRDSWKDKPITKITADDVHARMEAVWERGYRESARRLYEILRSLFVWAKKQRRYHLRYLPTEDIDPIAILGKKVRRKTILSDEYLQALWLAAGKYGYPAGHFVKLLLLTAVRRNEAAGARWDEFSFNGANEDAWIIPAHRMKMDAPHIVPITSAMAELLKPKIDEDDDGVPRFTEGPFVFSNSAGRTHIRGFTGLKEKLDKLMLKELRKLARARGEDPGKVEMSAWRLHDLRRTVRTHLSAIDVPEGDTVRELILAHRRRELHEIYDQHSYFNEKKIALERWTQRLRRIVETGTTNPDDARVATVREYRHDLNWKLAKVAVD
jgi:integrase